MKDVVKEELKDVVKEELKDLTSNLESIKLSHKFVINAMLDPWENIRSMTSEKVNADNISHKNSVCEYYNISKKRG